MDADRGGAEAPVGASDLEARLAELLTDLCAVDTTPSADVAAMARAEARVFDRIERELARAGVLGARCVRAPINPAIEGHTFYSRPHYTATDSSPEPLDAATTYAGRHNLVFTLDGQEPAGGLALNAHVDVVKPYIAPVRQGTVVHGRGACDDKGPLVAALGAVLLVADHLTSTRTRLLRPLTLMAVIDEETGGNGSLSLALDRDLSARYDTLLVLECTSGVVHTANRGAVWYKVEGTLPGIAGLELAAFVYDELEREGRAIKAESRHPMFPHRPVQTCHGVLGHYGEHPSRINGRVDLDIVVEQEAPRAESAADTVRDLIENGLAEYVALYGDKTKEPDPVTGTPNVARHYDLEATERGYTVQVHGSTGHMGSILRHDGALTKMAAMVRALVMGRDHLERRMGGPVRFELHNWDDPSYLLMEGGQGFVPTHELAEIKTRLANAVRRGAERYLMLMGHDFRMAARLSVSYDKLHNAAFAGAPDTPAALLAAEEAELAGFAQPSPARGWDVSCDARIFASERPGATVLTVGPGSLSHAHSDNEQVDVGDLARFARFLARFIVRHLGTTRVSDD